MSSIHQLAEEIRLQAQKYYEGEPEISDEEFDILVEQLRILDPSNALLTTPGWGYTPEGHLVKRAHSQEIGGLDKHKYVPGKEIKLFSEHTVISFKLDGGAAVAYYDEETGDLKYVLSRGDGFIGLDITENINPKSVPRKVSKGIYEVRGEVVMSKENFAKLEGYSHPRNAAVGISQSKYSTQEQKDSVQFVAVELLRGAVIHGYRNQLSLLQKEGFEVVHHETYARNDLYGVMTKSELDLEETFTPSKSKCAYPIDGAVLRDEYSAEAYALKFESEMAETVVLEIVLQKSGFGRLIPVARIQPVTLSGAYIEFVTCHNWANVMHQGIGVGAKIMVTRANEVIPYIVKVLDPVMVATPTHWITGGFDDPAPELEIVGCHLQIKDFDVESEVVKEIMSHFAPHGMGGATINAIVECYEITTISGLAGLIGKLGLWPEQTIAEIQGISKSGPLAELAIEMLRAIHTKPVDLVDVLVMSLSRNVGHSAATAIAKVYGHQELLNRVLSPEDSYTKIQWPTYLAEQGFRKNKEVLWKILSLGMNIQDYVEPPKIEHSYKVALTGKLSMPRKKLLEIWKEFGVTEASVGNADILVADGPSSSDKYTTAVSRGIPIMTESDVDKILRGNA